MSDHLECSLPGSSVDGDSLLCEVGQIVKNLPARWETLIQSLGWEDPLEKGWATHSSILAWKIPMDRGTWWATVHRGCKELDTTERASTDLEKYCTSADILPSARG